MLNFCLKICCLSFLGLLLGLPVSGQTDSIIVTKNFSFQDGIYFSFESFQQNRPEYKWKDLKVVYFTNPQSYLTQIESIYYVDAQGNPATINPRTIWGICLGGIPSVLLPETAVPKELATFAALRLRGKICYFSYESPEVRDIEMSAYNPLTGRPFRTGIVRREVSVKQEKMLHFQSGEIRDFSVSNFIDWIPDDPGLKTSVLELDEEALEEKLFRCLLIYVDRHAVYTLSSEG